VKAAATAKRADLTKDEYMIQAPAISEKVI
jgi:hypothetical protein